MDQESKKQANREIREAMARLLVAARKTAPESATPASPSPPPPPPEVPVELSVPAPERAETGRKVPVSIRLDADLLAALRATGRGWQSRANAMLRAAMGFDNVDGDSEKGAK